MGWNCISSEFSARWNLDNPMEEWVVSMHLENSLGTATVTTTARSRRRSLCPQKTHERANQRVSCLSKFVHESHIFRASLSLSPHPSLLASKKLPTNQRLQHLTNQRPHGTSQEIDAHPSQTQHGPKKAKERVMNPWLTRSSGIFSQGRSPTNRASADNFFLILSEWTLENGS